MAPGDTAGGSLINLGDLAKPATVLIEKISLAIGAFAQPWQIKRVARADAEAQIIQAKAQLEITEIQERAFRRMLEEEGKKQENIENIVSKSIPLLNANARPEDIDNDWYVHFFEKNRLISNSEMQSFWARMLAQQANSPGSFTKRSIDLVATFEKSDFELFTRFCTILWWFPGLSPLMFDIKDKVFSDLGLTFNDLNHLEYLGLIRFDTLGVFQRTGYGRELIVHYYGKPINLSFENPQDNNLQIGHVILTKAGEELATASGSKPSDKFFDYVIVKWSNDGRKPFSPISTVKENTDPIRPEKRKSDNP